MLVTKTDWVAEQLEMSKYIGKRKHRSQLTQQEEDSLHRRLEDVENWKMSSHAFDRLEEKGIKATYDDIVSTILNCDLVEYKIDYDSRINRCEERIVVRGRALTNRFYNLNVVYSVTKERVVTVWLNHINDNHSTLDWSIYDENMKVFGVE